MRTARASLSDFADFQRLRLPLPVLQRPAQSHVRPPTSLLEDDPHHRATARRLAHCRIIDRRRVPQLGTCLFARECTSLMTVGLCWRCRHRYTLRSRRFPQDLRCNLGL